jgi:hypothetical protein
VVLELATEKRREENIRVWLSTGPFSSSCSHKALDHDESVKKLHCNIIAKSNILQPYFLQ